MVSCFSRVLFKLIEWQTPEDKRKKLSNDSILEIVARSAGHRDVTRKEFFILERNKGKKRSFKSFNKHNNWIQEFRMRIDKDVTLLETGPIYRDRLPTKTTRSRKCRLLYSPEMWETASKTDFFLLSSSVASREDMAR